MVAETRHPSAARRARLLVVCAGAVSLASVTACQAGSDATDATGQRVAVGAPTSHDSFPDASTTGPSDGTRLKDADSMTIDQDGAVVEGVRVSGRIIIDADDVTIRDSVVQTDTDLYPIHVKSGTVGALIEDVEVDNLGGSGLGVFFQGSGTLRRADIHSAADGVRIQSGTVIVDSCYIHDLHRQPGGHHDTIQIRKGDDVTITGNNLQPFKESTGDPMNSAIQIGSLIGEDRISNLLVSNNLMNGGNHTINGGGRNEVESARYAGNEFGRDFRYSLSANLQNSVWEDSNIWQDTGEPAQ